MDWVAILSTDFLPYEHFSMMCMFIHIQILKENFAGFSRTRPLCIGVEILSDLISHGPAYPVQRCKNIPTCQRLSRKLVMSRFCVFWVEFFGTFWNFMLLFCIFCTIWVFGAFYAVLSQVIIVVIFALFGVKYFWLKPCLCKKNSFSMSDPVYH